ncbi:hypothetical protein [Intestinimonas butyriciproducens]|uniref:hypothetical protein n=1 Tax=Intestinimonas butyriciproducens TaxID=1297617 RepID=UPI003AF0D8B1
MAFQAREHLVFGPLVWDFASYRLPLRKYLLCHGMKKDQLKIAGQRGRTLLSVCGFYIGTPPIVLLSGEHTQKNLLLQVRKLWKNTFFNGTI